MDVGAEWHAEDVPLPTIITSFSLTPMGSTSNSRDASPSLGGYSSTEDGRSTTSVAASPTSPNSRSPSPPKRPRNSKNLSLNVIPSLQQRAQTFPLAAPLKSPGLAAYDNHHQQGGVSRRPSNLSINVDSAEPADILDAPPFSNGANSPTIQQRPSHRRSVTYGSSDIPFSTSNNLSTDAPPSREKRDAPYPEGPALILPPNIYLYSEPTIDIARHYDVVINVAKEVTDPFERSTTTLPTTPSLFRPPQLSPGFVSSSINTTPSSNWSSSGGQTSSSSRSPSSGVSQTQSLGDYVSLESQIKRYGSTDYLHILWDHNSVLGPELRHTVEFIERQNDAHKSILIHCQCGISRSATLIIALVMKVLKMDINAAYAYVKDKSPWIGPNMSLIYQLSDWQKQLLAAAADNNDDDNT